MNSRFPQYLAAILAAIITAVVFLPAVDASCPGAGDAGRAAMSMLCHQDPDRSFHVAGQQLSVCARCSGIYLGVFAGAVLLLALTSGRVRRPVSNLALLLGLGPMAADGALNFIHLFNSPSWLRFFTGLVFGLTASRALLPVLGELPSTIKEVFPGGGSKPVREAEKESV